VRAKKFKLRSKPKLIKKSMNLGYFSFSTTATKGAFSEETCWDDNYWTFT